MSTKRVYALRGLVRCGLCGRKMEGAARRQDVLYYRCNARTLVPGSASALSHPRQIYLREDTVMPAVNRWVGSLFDQMHRADTIEALFVADDGEQHRNDYVEDLRGRVRAAKVTMDRTRKALEAGWDPVELRDQYNAAVAEKQAAERARSSLPNDGVVTRKQLEVWVDELGDVGKALNAANPEDLGQLYRSLRLSLTYHHVDQRVDVEVDPMADRVDKVCVRGGT
ncbi:zinc ribbon domain-containing protein [Kribbella sp. NPDC051587]|uniref:zinc ribbon domain-containing protein n=1 Tax=Kribbella sp. NPDC051587 TaxID=3364119 RepID=UPI0037AF987D